MYNIKNSIRDVLTWIYDIMKWVRDIMNSNAWYISRIDMKV